MPNVAWTEKGAIDLNELEAMQIAERLKGRVLEVSAVDKFPKMTNYVVPSGVRIAHSARVRLGAYIGDGTTVMHEGFVNFNAGAIGPNMIEGRISKVFRIRTTWAASQLQELSRRQYSYKYRQRLPVVSQCRNDIPLRSLHNRSWTISRWHSRALIDEERNQSNVKARELAGQNDMLFIRNSRTGVVEYRTNRQAIVLNSALHSHN